MKADVDEGSEGIGRVERLKSSVVLKSSVMIAARWTERKNDVQEY
jgi:hypothetical protein